MFLLSFRSVFQRLKTYAIHLCQSVNSFYLNFISLDFKNILTSEDIQSIKYLFSLKRIYFIFCLIKMTSNYYLKKNQKNRTYSGAPVHIVVFPEFLVFQTVLLVLHWNRTRRKRPPILP